jgi:hypothetical protein
MADRAENRPQGASLEQMRVYARELHQLYRAEHQARQELEARTQTLEQKVRELAALNQLSQTRIRQNLQAQEALQDLLSQLKTLVAQAEAPPGKKT